MKPFALIFFIFLAPFFLSVGSGDVVRVACVGDSITLGVKIENPQENSYPAQLQSILGDRWAVGNFGVGGATLQKRGEKPYWTTRGLTQAREFSPHWVVIMLGTNDSRPYNHFTLGEFERDYRSLLEHIAQWPSRPQLILAVPPPLFPKVRSDESQVYEFLQECEQRLIELRQIIRDISEEKDLYLLDLYYMLGHHEDFFPDAVHPNIEGAQAIARSLAAMLMESPASL